MTKDEVVQGAKLTRARFLEPALAGSLSNPPSRALPSASDLGVWLWNTSVAFLETARGSEKKGDTGLVRCERGVNFCFPARHGAGHRAILMGKSWCVRSGSLGSVRAGKPFTPALAEIDSHETSLGGWFCDSSVLCYLRYEF